MSNIQLIVMICAYMGNRDADTYKDTETYRHQVKNLIESGMITTNGRGYYTATDKGRFWLEAVLKTPLPVMKWEIPND